MEFKDKVVIITGASSGIGLACAMEFHKLGSKVVLSARSYDKLEEISKQLDSTGETCLAVKTDVTLETDCKELMDKVLNKFGRIDILINNAGISMRAIFKDVDIHVLEKVMNVNFWGTVYCTKYALPHVIESHGTIAGISSIAGFHGLPGRTAYSASKAAMQGFLESVRIENQKSKMNVLIIAAGFTTSNIRRCALDAHGQPQGETPKPEERLMSAERVAKNIVRSIRKRKRNRIMTLEGQLLIFLQRIAPVFVDKAIYKKFKKEPNSPVK